MDTAYLVLEDGTVFKGTRFGAPLDAYGELVFTTGMGAYVETLSDPSYYGQIVIQTFPLIGTYGWIPEDAESGNCFIRAYIARECCADPSNFRCEKSLGEHLREAGVPGLCGVDTRALTKRLRECGVMNAALTSQPVLALDALKAYKVKGALEAVSCKESYTLRPEGGETRARVALIDYGAKKSIAARLVSRGCAVTVFPHDVKAGAILDAGFEGVLLSNGPGDPSENEYEIAQLRALLGKLPIFGICLGHQMLALAAGAKTYKLKYGHRGANQPVRDLTNGKITITSQNHGYAVDARTLPDFARERFVNANDKSCEGIDYPSLHAFSVQYHPEGSGGPLDSLPLFDEFIEKMEEVKRYAAQSQH